MTSETGKKDKPTGRDLVRRALVEKAAALFARKGIKAVSVREIASAARVNHGLVHRHFGSKDGLLRAVMTSLASDVVTKIGTAQPDERLPDLFASALKATVDGGLHWRILARALLDGEAPEDLQQGFPVVERLMAAARRENPSGLSDEALVTLILTVSLGLLVFEPYLKLATGQDDARWLATRRELSALAIKSVRT
jgi:AcrR family transcriptional regulator